MKRENILKIYSLGSSLLLHIVILITFWFWKINIPTFEVPWITLTFETYRAEKEGIPEIPGKGDKEKTISPEEKLPEEEAIEAKLKRLAEEEKALEKALFGNKNLGIKVEGLIAKRELMRYDLPNPIPILYDVRIKFRVTVDRNGNILSIEILQKGPPEVENSALNALRKWKFAPLPPGVRGTQEGTVTFVFKVSP